MVTLVKLAIQLNALSPILITVLGITAVVIGQRWNAQSAMVLSPGGNTAVVQGQVAAVTTVFEETYEAP